LASHNLIQHLHLIQSAGENATDSYASLASQGLKGVEALTLDYRVGWPLSIVLSRRAITKYQLLSRLLYFSKHVEAKLLTSWKGHQALKELNLRGALGPSFCLRHRMLHFLQNFVYYMTLEVISPRAHEMKEGMLNAKDMDEVLELHEKFLDSCLKECLLASQDLLKILTKIMTTCLLFADQMKRFENYNTNTNTNNNTDTNDNDYKKRQTRVKAQTNFIKKETAHDSFEKMLNKFSETFDSQLKEFLEKLWTDSYHYHPQLR
jgi:gamma-tubulin complex component 2